MGESNFRHIFSSVQMRIILSLLCVYALGICRVYPHVHIEMAYIGGNLVIQMNDFLNGIFPVEDYKITVPGDALVEAGKGRAMDQFISEGQYVCWLLPQNEDPRFIYLGFSGSGSGSGIFEGNRMNLRIQDVRGPGGVHCYTVGAFSDVQVLWSTADGIGAEDTFSLGAHGGHIHCNWLFTQPGSYEIDMICHAVIRSSRQTVSSKTATLFFKVEPPDPGLKIQRDPTSAELLEIEFKTHKSVRYMLFQNPEISEGLSGWKAILENPIIGNGDIICSPIDVMQSDSDVLSQYFQIRPIYAQP